MLLWGDSMTHDPLCPYRRPHDPGAPCQCDLIGQVREEERNRHLTYVVNVSVTGPDDDAALEKIKHILAPRMVVNVAGTRLADQHDTETRQVPPPPAPTIPPGKIRNPW